MESALHDIVHGLSIARAHADIIADDIEYADPKAAAIFRNFSEELWDVWKKYHPLLPTNQDIHLLQSVPKNESLAKTNTEHNANT